VVLLVTASIIFMTRGTCSYCEYHFYDTWYF